MAMNAANPLVMQSSMQAQQPLAGRALVVLCGLCYWFVALAFCYLDRRQGHFGFEALLWTAWTVLGFGIGVAGLYSQGQATRRLGLALTIGAGLLVFFPGLILYGFARWPAFAVLLVTPARAAVMYLRKDAYLCLASAVAVSLLVATHGSAEWTIWFYLGPAWLCAALALAWDYAGSVRLGAGLKSAMTMAFLGVTLVLAFALWTLLPRPYFLGLGFVPAEASAKPGERTDPAAGRARKGEADLATGDADGPDEGGDGAGQPSPAGRAYLEMSKAARDSSLPQWQRGVLNSVLELGAWAGAWAKPVEGNLQAGQMQVRRVLVFRISLETIFNYLVNLLLLLIGGLLIYRWRWRIGIGLALAGAHAAARICPMHAMRLASWSVRMALARAGRRIQPGESLREHVMGATQLAPLARLGMTRAILIYCACRFGGQPASQAVAREMHQAVTAALEVMDGKVRYLEMKQ